MSNGETGDTIPYGQAQMDIGPKTTEMLAGKVAEFIEFSRRG